MQPDADPDPSHSTLADLLLVDAPPGESGLVVRALRELGLDLAIHQTAGDPAGIGVAVDGLGRRPAIVLVDGGRGAARALAVVRSVRRQRELACAPVVVLGEFEDVDQIVALLRAGADSAVVKPSFVDLELRTIREVLRYWTHLAVLPPARMPEPHRGPVSRLAGREADSLARVADEPVAR